MSAPYERTTSLIIRSIIRVHCCLGPGFLESIYQRALALELKQCALTVELEKPVPVVYEGATLGVHRLDLVVENQVVVETKTVEALSKAHYAQIRSYLRASGLPVGILVNFAGGRADYRRVDAG